MLVLHSSATLVKWETRIINPVQKVRFSFRILNLAYYSVYDPSVHSMLENLSNSTHCFLHQRSVLQGPPPTCPEWEKQCLHSSIIKCTLQQAGKGDQKPLTTLSIKWRGQCPQFRCLSFSPPRVRTLSPKKSLTTIRHQHSEDARVINRETEFKKKEPGLVSPTLNHLPSAFQVMAETWIPCITV